MQEAIALATIVTPLLIALVGLLGHSKLEKIHVLVNSNMTRAQAEIVELKTKVAMLEKLLVK